MGFGNYPSREWDRDLTTIEDKSEYVAKQLLILPKLLPIEDPVALRKLRLKLVNANVNWMGQCERWSNEWIRFFWEDDSWDPEDEPSGLKIYGAWLRYAKRCDDKGEPPCTQWDEEPFSESTKHDSIITPPDKFFRLDTEIVQLLGEVHALAMGVLNKLYKGRVDTLLTYYLTNSVYDPHGELANQRDTALDWIRNGIETLLQATDRTLAGDVVDAEGGTPGAKQTEQTIVDSKHSGDEVREQCLNWSEICDALKRDNTTAFQRKLRDLNMANSGPIVFPQGRGRQPKAPKDELIRWFSSLSDIAAEVADESRLKSEDIRHSTAGYSFGRDATVVPEIGGSVKRRV